MPHNRRQFLSAIPALAIGTAWEDWAMQQPSLWPFGHEPMQEEDFWFRIQQAYTPSPNLINLNNGGVSPQPKIVQETFEHYNRFCNEAPTYYMWRILDQGREPLRQSLAELAGSSADELAIHRNSTESLVTVIMGLPLKAGDEVVLSKQDYPNMLNAWKWREKRDGIKLVYVNHSLPCEDENEISQRYIRLFTRKTRAVMITHMINWTGQIIPTQTIASEARRQNIEVLIDGAHSFAHFPFSIPELGGDYFGTSLHKWLNAPFGTGMLWVRKSKIAAMPPMFPGEKPESDDIRKFETLGTRSFATEMAIGKAIDFHLGIGAERKARRLHYLKNYWAEKLRELPGVKLHTSLDRTYGGALGLFSIDGKKPADIEQALLKEHGIHTVAIEWENISGVRVTPNLYTSLTDLDRFVKAVEKIARKT